MPITDIKAHFADGGTAVNGWCAIPSRKDCPPRFLPVCRGTNPVS